MSQEGVDLANLFPRLPQRRVRRRLVELVRALVEEGESEPVADRGRGLKKPVQPRPNPARRSAWTGRRYAPTDASRPGR